MTAIYLIRHGEIEQIQPRRFIGQRDLSLTATGIQQVEALGQTLSFCGIEQLYCSSLRRCRESAAILGRCCGLVATACDELREINLGLWEGLTVAEVQAGFPDSYAARGRDLAGFHPPEGESFTDLLARVWPAFSRIAAAASGPVAIVAHAGVNRVLLCHLLGMPLAHLFRLDQDYACCNSIVHDQGNYRLHGLNAAGAAPILR